MYFGKDHKIFQAIVTSPDKRLTLNQIYDWMISSVTYFSEKQDNACSAGWKVRPKKSRSEIVTFLVLELHPPQPFTASEVSKDSK